MSPLAMDPDASNDGSPRFSPVAFNDHAGQLWIVTILSLIYTALVAAARAYIKYQMFGFDDVLIALAMVRKRIWPRRHANIDQMIIT